MKENLKAMARRLTLKQLRSLSAVASTGTLSAAARELGVTPPAIALQLQLVEATIGLPLLERTKGVAKPTEAGAEVLAAAARIEAELLGCLEAVRALHGIDRGRVTVGVVSTAKYFAPRALAAFNRAHPHVSMSLKLGNREDIIAGLESLEFDLALMGRPPEEGPYEREVIGDHPHVIIASPAHPLARRAAVPLSALRGETFMLREPGSGTRLLMQRLFGADMPPAGTEMGSNETIKQAVIAGMGIALLSAHTIAAEYEAKRLAILRVEGLPIVRQWFVVKRREKRLLPAARALWDHLATEGGKFLPKLPPAPRAPGQPRSTRPRRTAHVA
jgi:LysR family transcriptional regulator, low CO2-responsive transcriptional regulator